MISLAFPTKRLQLRHVLPQLLIQLRHLGEELRSQALLTLTAGGHVTAPVLRSNSKALQKALS